MPWPPPRALAILLSGIAALGGLGVGIWWVFSPHTPRAELVWQAQTTAGIEATPAVVGDLLVVPSMDGTVWGYDARTGELRYRTAPALLGIASGMAVDGQSLYFGSDDRAVYALNAETGGVLARTATNGPVRSRPLRRGNRLYVGSDDSHLWTLELPGLRAAAARSEGPLYVGSPIAGDLVQCGDDVVFAPVGGDLYFLNTRTRAMRRAEIAGPIHSHPCASRDGTVWIGNDRGEVYAVDSKSLSTQLVVVLPEPVRSHLVAWASYLLVGANDGSLTVLRSGEPGTLYSHMAAGPVRAAPVLWRGLVGFGADDGVFRVLELSSQRVVSAFRVGATRISAAPVLGPDGLVYLAGAGGAIRALRRPSGRGAAPVVESGPGEASGGAQGVRE